MALPQQQQGFTVTDQREGMEQGPSNNIIRGVRISFSTTAGHQGSVFVPAALYSNLDYVRQQLSDAAAQMIAVAGITG